MQNSDRNNQPGRPRPQQAARPTQPARSPQAGAPRQGTRPAGTAGRQPVQQQGQRPRQQTTGQPRRPSGPPPKQKGNRWFRATVMVLATLVGCVFLSFFILRSASDLFGLNQPDMAKTVKVPEESTILSVAELLEAEGIVDQSLTFRVYASLKLTDEEVKAGEYLFNSNMGYDEIIRDLRTGRSEREVVTIFFVEGSTIYDIARKLEEKKVCKADDFLEYLQSETLDYEFMDRLPNNQYRFRRLEGYVFPDTYEFYVGEKVPNVVAKFLTNFENKITNPMESRMQQLNMTLDEIITLASIIQKEADTSDEMKRVSAVFHNRLDRSDLYPRLQSDVTIFYVERFIKPFLTNTNQEMYDAYNTYVGEGLPPGPICNPGLEAIEAALYPANNNNYFFVTDSEGIYYYADNAQTHYDYVQQAAAVGGKDIHGTDTQ